MAVERMPPMIPGISFFFMGIKAWTLSSGRRCGNVCRRKRI